MSKKIIFTIIAVLILGVLVFAALTFDGLEDTSDNSVVDDRDTNTQSVDETVSNADQSPGVYTDYSPEEVSSADEDTKIILFFHADWCPTCRSLDADIRNNLERIPGGTKILKLDFDEATELKQEYDVRIQHTLVQINTGGHEIVTWHQSRTLTDLLTEVR